MNNWKTVVAAAFGLALFYSFFPVITLIAGAVILAVFYRQDIGQLAGKTVSFAKVFLIAFALAIGFQVIFTILFGAHFHDLWQAGGLAHALNSSAAIKTAIAKEVFALLATACAVYLIISSERIQRWWFWTGLVFSVACMAFQCFDAYAPLTAESTLRHRQRLSLFREAMLASFSASINNWGQALDRATVFKEYEATLPNVYYALAEARLYSLEGETLAKGEAVEAGSKWFHLTAGYKTVLVNGIAYLPVATYADGQFVGYLRIDRLSNRLPRAVKVEVPTLPTIATPIPELQPDPAELLEPLEPLSLPPLPPAPALPPDGLNADRVVARIGDWACTKIVPQRGDLIRLGYFANREDVERLAASCEDVVLPELNPMQIEHGRYWYAVLECQSDRSGPLALKLKHGAPLQVAIQKL